MISLRQFTGNFPEKSVCVKGLNVLTVEVWIAISPGPIPDMQPHIINELGILIVFFRQSSL